MKRTLFIFIILLLNSIIYSQSITWQKVYKGPGFLWPDCFANDICFADSNNFFVIGTNEYPRGIYVIKINPYGDTIWTKFIENGEGIAGVSSGDGGCVVTGLWHNYSDVTMSYSLKINSGGNIEWQKLYDSAQTALCYEIIRTSDDKYLACGKIGYQLGYIIKIDSSGNMIWQKSYPSADNKSYRALIETNDGSYIAGGHVTDTPYETGKGVLTKIDTSGNIIWERRYNTYLHSMGNILSINKVNQNYLITGHAYDTIMNKYGICFMRLDLQGNVVFSKFYPQPDSGYYWMPDFKIINPNKYLFSYNRYGSSALDSILANAMITDSLGNIIIQREFSSTDYTYFSHIILNNNNDILFAGTSNHINIDFENIYVVRTDSNLYAPPIVINNIGLINPDDYKLYQNYPNPFNPTTNINYDLPNDVFVTIKVYDVLGKEVSILVNGFRKTGRHTLQFNGSGLSSGIYFYKLEAGSFTDIKRMLMIK
jgi:hypothetical protein